jgi:hypothetical protein
MRARSEAIAIMSFPERLSISMTLLRLCEMPTINMINAGLAVWYMYLLRQPYFLTRSYEDGDTDARGVVEDRVEI